MLVMEEPATPIAKTDMVGVPVLSCSWRKSETKPTLYIQTARLWLDGLGFPRIVLWLGCCLCLVVPECLRQQ